MDVTLLDHVRTALEVARAAGALVPLGSRAERVDGFDVRVLTGFGAKPRGRATGAPSDAPGADPFAAPHGGPLFVADWPPDHALLLNKFPVLDDHVLAVTKVWAPQEEPPAPSDVRAMDALLDALDGLAFYNGGVDAGASQPHRHLQLVSREATGGLPLEPAIVDALARGDAAVPDWPFVHAIAPPKASLEPMFQQVGRDPRAPGPHSVLATRTFRLVVPRTTGVVDGMPVNSLGYAGLLAVKSQTQLDHLRVCGPWEVLSRAGVRRPISA